MEIAEMTMPEKSLEYFKLEDLEDLKSVRLRIIQGVHEGAEFDLSEKSVLMIGSDINCDIILSDVSIANRHCIIHSIGSSVWIRPIEGQTSINEDVVEFSEERSIDSSDIVHLGDTQFLLVNIGNSETTNLDDLNVNKTAKKHDLVPAIGFISIVFVVAVLLLFQPNIPAVFASQQPGVSEVEENLNTTGGLIDNIPNGTDPVDKQQKVADQLAKNVEEIMRLSGIVVTSQNIGDGEVAITGYFGDETLLNEIIHSRSIQEIASLKKITANNLDAPKADPININAVVEGDKPYIVLNNGSRYYLGVTLDNGFKLAAIEGNDVIFETKKGPKRVKGADAWVLN